ncbi:alternative sigma factor RpoH [Bradyrhizobium sp. LM2.7]
MQAVHVAVASHRFRPDNDHFNGYASVVRRYELLEPDQEQQLARRWQESKDQHAANALVTSHLRLAHKLARSYRGYGLPLADLMAEASVGLVLAASKYQPDRGSRFSTYAAWWIRASIREYILRSWSLVKIGTTAAQKKLFFRLRGEKRRAKERRSRRHARTRRADCANSCGYFARGDRYGRSVERGSVAQLAS